MRGLVDRGVELAVLVVVLARTHEVPLRQRPHDQPEDSVHLRFSNFDSNPVRTKKLEFRS